jgi:hypothetical protein
LWFIISLSTKGIPIPKLPERKLTMHDLIAYGEMQHLNDKNETILPKTIFWTNFPLRTDKKGASPIIVELKNEILGNGMATGALVHVIKKDSKYIFMRQIATFPATLEESNTTMKCVDIQ